MIPVILSGGSGTRLWPVSTPARPKQLIALTDELTMLQLTARRVGGEGFAAPMVVGNARHTMEIEAQLEAAGTPAGLLISEPVARNTAPAIALAALAAEPANALLLVMPSDHVIADVPAFHAAIARAAPLVTDGWLCTFGIEPDRAETGYGYIARGAELGEGLNRVDRFIEKPPLDRAEAMLADGGYAWNAGIFLFRADRYLEELERHAPAIAAAARRAHELRRMEGVCSFPDMDAFAASPSESVDYAIMEKADRVIVAPVSMGWSDVGSWDALHAIAARDGDDNALSTGSLAIDSRNCLVRSDGPTVSLVGVEDLIVLVEGNHVVIVHRSQAQRVKELAGLHADKSQGG